MQEQQAHVLACVDGASLTESVCDYAAWLSQRLDAPLKLLHTINHHQEKAKNSDFSGQIGLGSQEHLLEEMIDKEQQDSKQKISKGKMLLQQAKQRVADSCVDDASCVQRHGELAESLRELETEIRVLVLGLRGQVHDHQENQIGAKLEGIIRALHKPVLVVNGAFKEPKTMMLAYDGSQAADKAVDMVASRDFFKGLHCYLVCVNDNAQEAKTLLDKASDRLQASGIEQVSTELLQGKVDQELCDFQNSNTIDLTVMGAFSHTRLHDIFMGSLTHSMLLNSKNPLLLLR